MFTFFRNNKHAAENIEKTQQMENKASIQAEEAGQFECLAAKAEKKGLLEYYAWDGLGIIKPSLIKQMERAKNHYFKTLGNTQQSVTALAKWQDIVKTARKFVMIDNVNVKNRLALVEDHEKSIDNQSQRAKKDKPLVKPVTPPLPYQPRTIKPRMTCWEWLRQGCCFKTPFDKDEKETAYRQLY